MKMIRPLENPTKPIGRFMTKEQAQLAAQKYGHEMREDAGGAIAVW